MNTGPTVRKTINGLIAAGLLVMISPCVYSDAEDSPGWMPDHFLSAQPWKEQQTGLPAYPEEGDLLEVNIGTGGMQYKLYLDPLSVTTGKDSVVRYTVVMISATGVWNVSNEGLHCGKKRYRRYAYGYGGDWHELENEPWSPLSGRGVNRYRWTFYNDYMCNQADPFRDPRQIVERFRSSDYGYEE